MMLRGDIAEARQHLDQSITYYNAAEHRPLATRFGEDQRVAHLCQRSWTLWMLGYPDRALADNEQAIKDAGEISQAGTLMFALNFTSVIQTQCGNYAVAGAAIDESNRFGRRKERTRCGTPSES